VDIDKEEETRTQKPIRSESKCMEGNLEGTGRLYSKELVQAWSERQRDGLNH